MVLKSLWYITKKFKENQSTDAGNSVETYSLRLMDALTDGSTGRGVENTASGTYSVAVEA